MPPAQSIITTKRFSLLFPIDEQILPVYQTTLKEIEAIVKRQAKDLFNQSKKRAQDLENENKHLVKDMEDAMESNVEIEVKYNQLAKLYLELTKKHAQM